MQTIKQGMLVVVLFWSVFVPVCSAETTRGTIKKKKPTAIELLGKFAKNKELKLRSFCMTQEIVRKDHRRLSGNSARANGRYTRNELWKISYDVDRLKVFRRLWGDVSYREHIEKKEQAKYTSYLWDGTQSIVYSYSNLPEYRDHPGTLKLDKTRTDKLRGEDNIGIAITKADGYFYQGSGRRIESFLPLVGNMSVKDEMEIIGGVKCYVLEAEGKCGKYKVWIDPEHGYNIAKATDHQEVGDLINIESTKLSKRKVEGYIDNVKFEKIQGVWISVEADFGGGGIYPDGDFSKADYHMKRTNIVLNPDHDKLGSFVPDKVRNGARVNLIGQKRLRRLPRGVSEYTWKDGTVVDMQGREVDMETLKPQEPALLIGKPLPSLVQLGAKLDNAEKLGKKLLVCFFDMNQRPSRHMMSQLAKQAKKLKEKGVAVICVQASMLEKDKLDEWLKKNEVSFSVGMIESDEEKVRFNWGVKSLPWLVLTDKKNVVRAEGFGIDELNEKIKDS